MQWADRLAPWLALALGLAAAVVGTGMVLSLFLIPFGVPMLGYAWVRLHWAYRGIRRVRIERGDYLNNVLAGGIALFVYVALAIALWPGRVDGYLVGLMFALTEVALIVAALRGADEWPLWGKG